ncbi:MAG: hypothetical protein KGI98_16930 [Euryarchaeota archaeon]|nr:hypothetical protein [Euryarchaeota archaeon]
MNENPTPAATPESRRMPNTPNGPNPPPKSFSRGEPRLLLVEGQKWPSKCACGCGEVIPAGPSVELVLEVGARPRKAWLPEHSPQADRARTQETRRPQSTAASSEVA